MNKRHSVRIGNIWDRRNSNIVFTSDVGPVFRNRVADDTQMPFVMFTFLDNGMVHSFRKQAADA